MLITILTCWYINISRYPCRLPSTATTKLWGQAFWFHLLWMDLSLWSPRWSLLSIALWYRSTALDCRRCLCRMGVYVIKTSQQTKKSNVLKIEISSYLPSSRCPMETLSNTTGPTRSSRLVRFPFSWCICCVCQRALVWADQKQSVCKKI